MEVKIKGLKKVSEVGYPKPLEEDDIVESVYFLACMGDFYDFRLGTYNFETMEFRADNGYGGEIYHREDIVAWNYWYDNSGKYLGDGVGVTFSPIE
ncbi:MAG: hypothetical protein ACI4M3_06175 [Acutalibacteraceae bacterium]